MGIVDFDTGTWTDRWFRALKPEAKNVFLYLWTNNHKNIMAMYEIDFEQIAFELNMTLPKVIDTLRILYPKIYIDEENNIVWVVNYVRRQFMRTDKISPRIIEGIRKSLILMKGHVFVTQFLELYKCLDLFNSDKPYPYPLKGYEYPSGKGEGKGKGKGKGEEESEKKPKFIPPTLQEVTDYCKERNNGVNPKIWFNHYTAKGWKIGKTPMVDWKAAVHTWEKDKGESIADRYKPL